MRDLTIIGIFIKRELLLEFRRKSVIGAVLLYLAGLTFICYFTFSLRQNTINQPTWSALFWLIVLFTSLNSIPKNFILEKRGLMWYHYYLISPGNLIFARILYNTLLSIVLIVTTVLLFTLFIGNPIENYWIFGSIILLVSWGFAAALTLISALAARTSNENVMMAILGFPAIIAILLLAIRATTNSLEGLDPAFSLDEIYNLTAINCILTALAYILFPYIWRS